MSDGNESKPRKLDSVSTVVLLEAANRALGQQRGNIDLLRAAGDLSLGQMELLDAIEGCCVCSGSYVLDILNHLSPDDAKGVGKLSNADILGDLGERGGQ